MSPKYSIAMATYNGAHFIQEQLDSILNQTISDFELIICDDCSTDSTLEILKKYECRDSRVHVYKNEKNIGFKKNFEKACSLCSGEFIALSDQDDIWYPNHLEILLSKIGSNDCIGANALFIDEFGKSMHKTMKSFIPIHQIPLNREEVFKHEIFDNIIQGAASLFRRDILKKAFPIPNNVKYHDYWIALIASLNNGCFYTDNVILKYRRHQNNVTSAKKFTIFKAYSLLKEASLNNKEIYQNHINLIKEVLQSQCIAFQKEEYLKEALLYYTYLFNREHIFSNLRFYLINYKDITLSNKRRIPFFLFKLFGFIWFGVK